MKNTKTPEIVAIVLALISLVVTAAVLTAIWLTSEVTVFGLVMLLTAIVAGLLFVWFDWRAKLRTRILTDRDYKKAA